MSLVGIADVSGCMQKKENPVAASLIRGYPASIEPAVIVPLRLWDALTDYPPQEMSAHLSKLSGHMYKEVM